MATAQGADWMQGWDSLSRQYWNAWRDLSQQAAAENSGSTVDVPWHEGLEQWARMFSGSGAQSRTVERLLASAKDYTAFMQSMIQTATSKGTDGNAAAWTDALRNSFNLPGTDATLLNNPMARAMREIGEKGAKGFEQMMAGLRPLLDPVASEAKGWLGMPAFGYLREHQEHYQKMATALVEYQEQNTRYNALMLKASQRGFELFEDKLAAREEPGRQIDSLRALYDLWVDAAEEAYAEIALSPEFREVYGALVNSQMRVRSQLQQEVERIGTDLGMPTRSELDSIGKRLHDMRRELKARDELQAAADVAGEVAALRREVAALKARIGDK
ncbi:MAG: class III poly(R)-hydroxyalkanoic acid synthase subunit PhaE, partial [Rhodanobacteraceae bacterium]